MERRQKKKTRRGERKSFHLHERGFAARARMVG
jgi:hypothetical protein